MNYEVTLDDDGLLLCPYCDDQNGMHHGNVVVMRRAQEDEVRGSRVVLVSRDTVSTREAKTGEFPGRRDAIRIAMSCEACGRLPTLLIQQHKGATIFRWERRVCANCRQDEREHADGKCLFSSTPMALTPHMVDVAAEDASDAAAAAAFEARRAAAFAEDRVVDGAKLLGEDREDS